VPLKNAYVVGAGVEHLRGGRIIPCVSTFGNFTKVSWIGSAGSVELPRRRTRSFSVSDVCGTCQGTGVESKILDGIHSGTTTCITCKGAAKLEV
jgi:hypothetical protein